MEIPHPCGEHAGRVWMEHPEFFLQGPGLAKYFGPGQVELQYRLLVLGSFVLPFLLLAGLIYYEKKSGKRLHNVEPALILVTLTYFHSMIVVSYLYLFYTPVFFALTMAVLSFHSRQRSVR